MDQEIVQAARALLPDGAVYADWAASALPLPSSGKPCFIPPAHNKNSNLVAAARSSLSKFFNDENERYYVIFTSGATASLRILAERLPWSKDSSLVVHSHVHNAVLGMRNPAVAAGATFRSFRSDELDEVLTDGQQRGKAREVHRNNDSSLESSRDFRFAVLAYPGECNLTGTVYPLRWARQAKRNGILQYSGKDVITLVDTAKLAASSPIDIGEHDSYVDAFVFSAYKLTSSNAGLGALFVRKGSRLVELLQSTAADSYFAGGRSVNAISPFSTELFVPADTLVEQLEVGTPNLQAIYHLPTQLSWFSPSKAVMAGVRSHACGIAETFCTLLREVFTNERVEIHRDQLLPDSRRASSVVCFTLYRQQSVDAKLVPIGYSEIATVLEINHVFARAGCMCNTGACASVLGLSDADVTENYRLGHRCDDGKDLLQGRPTGVVRVSFGWASSQEDASKIIDVLRTHISTRIARQVQPSKRANQDLIESPRFRVECLLLYPVKSCGGFVSRQLTSDDYGSPVGDRVFGILDVTTQRLLNLKSNPSLAWISAQYSSCKTSLVMEWHGKELEGDVEPVIVVKLPDEVRQKLSSDTERLGRSLRLNCGISQLPTDGKHHPSSGHSINGDHVLNWLRVTTASRSRLVVLTERKKYRDGIGSVLLVSKDELLCLSQESGTSTEVLRAAVRPNVVVEAAGASPGCDCSDVNVSIYDCDQFYNRGASLIQRRQCQRCVVVNSVTTTLTGATNCEPLRAIARLNKLNERRGLVFGVICTFKSRTLLSTGDMLLTSGLQ